MHKILKGAVVVTAIYGAAHGANQLYSNVFKFGDPTPEYQISELKTNLSELQINIVDIQVQADEDRRNLVVAQEWETVREVDLAKSKDALVLAAQDLEQKISELNTLTKDNKNLTIKLDEAGQINEESASAINVLENKIVDIGALLETQTEQTSMLATALQKGNQGLLSERKKRTALDKGLNQSMSELAMLKKQNQMLNSDLQSQSKAKDLALKTQTDIQAKTSEQIAQLETDIVTYKMAVQKAEASYQASIETIQQLEAKLSTFKTPKIAALDGS
tara:strand:- start:48 stop:875 length:828 start_codon:yes stop_codon:yes gene_type:complete